MQCVLRKLCRPWQLNRLSRLFSLLFQILIAKLLQNDIGFVIRVFVQQIFETGLLGPSIEGLGLLIGGHPYTCIATFVWSMWLPHQGLFSITGVANFCSFPSRESWNASCLGQLIFEVDRCVQRAIFRTTLPHLHIFRRVWLQRFIMLNRIKLFLNSGLHHFNLFFVLLLIKCSTKNWCT